MENLHIYLLMFALLLVLSFAYELPKENFINCGSDAPVHFRTRSFVGDGRKFSSKETWPVQSINNQLPPLYQTARIFKQPSHYEFEISENGTYLIRLHFLPFSSPTSNLSTAIFDVSAAPKFSNSGFKLLSNFTSKNSTSNNSPLIKEFFLKIHPIGSFRIYFIPKVSSFAFVNAIELFPAPANFSPENHSLSFPFVLHTTYRVNVGGQQVTSDTDPIWRNWEQDDRYLSDPSTAITVPRYSSTLNYFTGVLEEQDTHFYAGNEFIAPEPVYRTAKAMNVTPTRPFYSFNMTWSFNVSRNSRHLVRTHFCDIVGQPGNVVFNLFSNGNFSKKLGAYDSHMLTDTATPYYYDFVVNSDANGIIRISIGARPKSTTKTGFLNGLEMFELMEGSAASASIPYTKDPKKTNVGRVVGSVLGSILTICILVVAVLRHRKAQNSEWPPRPTRSGEESARRRLAALNSGLKIPFAELEQGTENFGTQKLLGEGGFGNVYKGTLLDGRKVAVKRAKRKSDQGRPEFYTEIFVLSKIHHRHLVSLVGYCDENSEMILVYEFMENGTLRDHLYNADVPRLSWKKRLEICIGAARGLNYLHTFDSGGVIHRDVKSTNILLDEHYNAKVADFGLSKYGSTDETHVNTIVKGTIGYLDPDYMLSEQLSEKADVYSFGVVLLEVLCARPAIDRSLPREQMNLGLWALHCKREGVLDQIVDSSLKGQIDHGSLRVFGDTIEKCLRKDAHERPTMGNVLRDLDEALRLHLAPNHEVIVYSNASSAAMMIPPYVEHFDSGVSDNASVGTTPSQIFSQLKFGEAR